MKSEDPIKTKLSFIYHPIFLEHDPGSNHPERPSRLQAILRRLKKTPILEDAYCIEPSKATIKEIELVHSKEHHSNVKSACKDGPKNLDPDTVVSERSFEASLYAAGGAICAINAVMDKRSKYAFCCLRPPGHHARPGSAMGFCLFNNIAIGARYIQEYYKLSRILIIDWDVHHGNGTEEAFYEDPSVLYISLHQYPHYPGTGSKEDIGKGKGKGFNLNVEMKVGAGNIEYIKAFQDIIVPRIEKFEPEFVLISAGFDGHKDDPLSGTCITEEGFSSMTNIVKDLAKKYAQDRLVSVLEGGYNLIALANSTYSHLESLTN